MQSSKTITDQFEELIKKAKELNKTHPVIAEERGANQGDGLNSVKIEMSMLQKRHDMCIVQKNAIKDLIKLHKEELQLLESALRTIESEEKKILEVILRETADNDLFAKATSVEMIERDNDTVKTQSIHISEDVSLSTTHENFDYEASRSYVSSNNGDPEYSNDDYFSKSEIDSDEYNDHSDYSVENISSRHTSGRGNSSDRKVRFSMNDLGVISETKSNNTSKSGSSYATNLPRPSSSIKGTISIPQRYNYIRNRNSSLMKEISIKKILEGNRKLDIEEKDQDQKELVRKLHVLYSSKK